MPDSEGVIRGRDRLMTPAEVARVFRVDPKTVSRWAKSGQLSAVRATPRSHRRFRESEVRALLEGGSHNGDVNEGA